MAVKGQNGQCGIKQGLNHLFIEFNNYGWSGYSWIILIKDLGPFLVIYENLLKVIKVDILKCTRTLKNEV